MSTEKTAVTYPGRLGGQYTGLSAQKSHFSVVFHEEYVAVMINDFTKHLIFSRRLRRQKCRREREEKNKEKNRRRSERRNYIEKCSHSFKYIIDHPNVRFFFLNSLWACTHSLNDLNSSQCVVWFLLYYLLHLFSSDYFAAVTIL